MIKNFIFLGTAVMFIIGCTSTLPPMDLSPKKKPPAEFAYKGPIMMKANQVKTKLYWTAEPEWEEPKVAIDSADARRLGYWKRRYTKSDAAVVMREITMYWLLIPFKFCKWEPLALMQEVKSGPNGEFSNIATMVGSQSYAQYSFDCDDYKKQPDRSAQTLLKNKQSALD